jgi:hypothetical protein
VKQIQIYRVVRERRAVPYSCDLVALDGVFALVSDCRFAFAEKWRWWLCNEQVIRRREDYSRVFLANAIAAATGLRWASGECIVHLDGDYLNVQDDNLRVMQYETAYPEKV